MRIELLLAWFAMSCSALSAADDAKPFLHPLFVDHMVLQRDQRDPVWGWTASGTTVTVAIGGATVTAVADAQGRWRAAVGPLPAGGPVELTVSDAQHTVTVTDVLVGDVWLCSGQSNMEMGIGAANDAQNEIAHADDPQLRLFTVQKIIVAQPLEVPAGGSWAVCTPATVSSGGWGGFSAVGYYFGRHLRKTLGVPIGLIHSSWGGTRAEAWTSEEALGALPAHRDEVASFGLARSEAGRTDAATSEREWFVAHDAGSAAAWQEAATDDAQWKEMDLPGHWEDHGLPDFDGVVWFRKHVAVPAEWAGKELTLSLGPIDDRDTTWFDGERVGGKDSWDSPRVYQIPGELAKAGDHVIAVRVLDTGGPGGLYGAPAQLSLALSGAPATALPLAGAWRFHDSTPLAKLGALPGGAINQNSPTVLYDGMIAPLIPFAITGAIWYQGEANAWNAADYRPLLSAMIGDWRARFGCGEFPFLIVQLASFMDRKPEPAESQWAELRESQALVAREVPRCGLAVAIDIGDAKDIHPKNKQDVGRRLGLAAEAVAYARKTEDSGPVFREMAIVDGKARLSFDHLGGGLEAVGGALLGFAIAGADGAFVWADAVIDGDQVVVSSPTVPAPTRVRYAWADSPDCTLVNKAGLPAVPFRTDAPKR